MTSSPPSLPRYRIITNVVLREFTEITILCNCTLFAITLDIQDKEVKGTRLEIEYERRVLRFIPDFEPSKPWRRNERNDRKNYHKFSMWVLDACTPVIRELLPSFEEEQSISLEQFAQPKFYHIKLVPTKTKTGRTVPLAKVVDHVPTPKYSSIPFELIPIEELGEELKGKLELVSAAEVTIPPFYVPEEERDDELLIDFNNMCDIPRLVYLSKEGGWKFFKPCTGDRSSFLEDVERYHRVSELGLQSKLRIPKFHGLVISSDGTKILGMLLDWLPFGLRSMEHPQIRRMKHMREKWEEQVNEILRTLHSQDLTWGRPSPEHVLIDHDLNAWIFQFGEFMPSPYASMTVRQIRKTINNINEGKKYDLRIVKRMFRNWVQRDPIGFRSDTESDAESD